MTDVTALNPDEIRLTSGTSFSLQKYIYGVPWRDGFNLGTGIDALTGSVMQTAIVPSTFVPDGTFSLTQFNKSVTSEEDSEALFSGLFSASVNIEGISGSASVSFLSEVSYSSRSSTIVFYRNDLENNYGSLTGPALTSDAMTCMKAGGDAFRNQYGDYYISGVMRGSQLIFMLEFSSQTEAEHTQFMSSIGVNIPDQLSSDFQAAVNSAATSTHTSINMTFYQNGADEPSTAITWEQSDLDDAIKNYINTLTPVPMFAALSHYSTLPDTNLYPSTINADPDAATYASILYRDYWSITQQFLNTDPSFTPIINAEYQLFNTGLMAHQEDLITDPGQYAFYRTLADRLLAYFQAIAAIPAEQGASGINNNESKSGPQSWQFGFRDVTRGGVRVATANVLRENHGDTGHKGGQLQFEPQPPAPTAVIVGWDVNANWTDGTDGYWSKSNTLMLMSSSGNIWAQSEAHRGLNWTANFYYVVPGDLTPPQ